MKNISLTNSPPPSMYHVAWIFTSHIKSKVFLQGDTPHPRKKEKKKNLPEGQMVLL